MQGPNNLEKSIVLYSLSNEAFNSLNRLLEYFGKAYDAAFNCVLVSPFSREISKEYHSQYVLHKRLFIKELRKYF